MRTLFPSGRPLVPVFALLSALSCGTLLAQNIPLPKLKPKTRPKSSTPKSPTRMPATRPRYPVRRPVAVRRPTQAELQAAAQRTAAGRARTWLGQEQKLLAEIDQAQRGLPLAPPAETPPANLFVDPSARVGTAHLYRVQLSLLRDDGKRAIGPALAPEMLKIELANQSPIVTPRADGCQIDSFGMAPASLRLHLPEGWEYTENRPGDRAWPLDWSRAAEVETSEAELPPLPKGRDIAALPVGPEDVAAAKEALQALQNGNPTPLPRSDFPSPAAHCQKALDFVTVARAVIEKTAMEADTLSGSLATLSADAIAAERRRIWRQFQQALERLELAEEQVTAGTRALNALEQVNGTGGRPGPRELLGAAYPRLQDQKVTDLLHLAHVRQLQYRAVVLWWQAQLEDPQHPDRRTALQVLDAERIGKSAPAERVAEASAQLSAFQDAARQEGEGAPEAMPPGMGAEQRKRKVLLHTYQLAVSLNRSMVPLRLRKEDLNVDDTCFLAKGPAPNMIVFKQDEQSGIWSTWVPRSDLANDGRLIVQRGTADSVLERAFSLVNVDPYEADQRTLDLPAWDLHLFRKFEIKGVTGEPVKPLAEVPPLPNSTDLGELREKCLDSKYSQYGRDGTWWVGPSTSGLSWRLRASPKQAFLSTNNSQRMRGWATVDAIRLDSVDAGHVAGIRVESAEEKLLSTLGPGTLTAEGRSYLNGGLLFTISNQKVTSIQIASPLGHWVNQPIPAVRPGTITRVDYDNALIYVQKGPKLSMEKDARFEIAMDGLSLFERDTVTGAQAWAIVVSATDDQVICKLMRQDKGDCTSLARTIPCPETALLLVRPLGQ